MIRRVLIVAFCFVTATAGLAESLCFTGCETRDASESHHSCGPERDDATAINAAPQACRATGASVVGGIEVRHTVAAVAMPQSVRFDPWLPIAGLAGHAASVATDFSPQLNIPLRI